MSADLSLSTGAEPLRAGIVGCDTSHVIAFTKLINASDATGPRANVEVVVAYPGGSPDLPTSADRVGPYTEELRGMGIEIVDSIPALLEKCDVVLLESVDGRPHLSQFEQLAVGKPVFIDKPAAANLADVIAIFRLAEKTKTPCFSSSGLRYCSAVTKLAADPAIGDITGCSVASPFETEPHHIDLAWYGVHGVEAIYALMSPGCEAVSRVNSSTATLVTGRWADGRIAAWRGLKDYGDYAFTAFGAKGMAFDRGFSGYEPLVDEICTFFTTRNPPVPAAETIEMFAFMEAADESLRRDSALVSTKEMITRAEQQLADKGQKKD
ncbi:MAG: dehydrogenase [Pirellula sp.]|nr:dehydrogenase [Pirellula sp.]